MKLTHAEENYLKAIWKLEIKGSKVSTNAISRELATSAPSVTDMIKKLAAKKLVAYSRYKSVSLLPSGRKAALLIVRKHRLWELFLVQKLGFGWDKVHEIAEQLEHIDSEALVDKLDAYLQFPIIDPHGDPIPGADGKLRIKPSSQLLSNCAKNQKVKVTGVTDSSPEFLHLLNQLEIGIGTEILINRIFDFEHGMDVITHGNRNIILTKAITQNLIIHQITRK